MQGNIKTENRIQQEIFQYFWNNHCLPSHKPREIIYHVPNEGAANYKLIPIGLYPGAADLVHTWRGQHYYCEVKTETGIQSPSQKKFQQHIEQCGYTYYLVRSLEEFKRFIHNSVNHGN
jgi:hypothetical protein